MKAGYMGKIRRPTDLSGPHRVIRPTPCPTTDTAAHIFISHMHDDHGISTLGI